VECEVEAEEVERPSGLPPVQLLGRHEVLQVLVVHRDLALMFRTLDKVPPLLEGSDDCQHLLVLDLVVPFDRGQGLGEESDWVPLFVRISGRGLHPLQSLELSASMWKGLVGSGEMRTRAEVTLPFNLANAVCSASPKSPAPTGIILGQVEERAGVF